MEQNDHDIINGFLQFAGDTDFPCAGARSAVKNNRLQLMVADHLACPKDDQAILRFIYNFTEDYRKSQVVYQSAGVIFREPAQLNEEGLEKLFWQRLQALADADRKNYGYDERVNSDPASPHFSFSLKQEAFFIIYLHPASERKARNYSYPVIIFNPHEQFEMLKAAGSYEKFKQVIRERDKIYSGSVNPMLDDHGHRSEARQYSGKSYTESWECPLIKR